MHVLYACGKTACFSKQGRAGWTRWGGEGKLVEKDACTHVLIVCALVWYMCECFAEQERGDWAEWVCGRGEGKEWEGERYAYVLVRKRACHVRMYVNGCFSRKERGGWTEG